MNVFRLERFLVFVAVALPSVGSAAQPGWYFALDGGPARYNGLAGSMQGWISTLPLPPQGMVNGTSEAALQQEESHDTGYRFSVGYQINRYFGVEGAYVILGEVHASGNGRAGLAEANGFLPLESLVTFADTVRLRARGWELAATGNWPLSPQWSLLGRVGVLDAHSKLDIASTPVPPAANGQATSVSESSSKWTPTYGVGVSFAPVDHWTVRLGWDRYAHLGDRNITMGGFNVNLVSLGVVYTL